MKPFRFRKNDFLTHIKTSLFWGRLPKTGDMGRKIMRSPLRAILTSRSSAVEAVLNIKYQREASTK